MWVQHPEVKSGSFWVLSPRYLPKNKAPRTPKRKTKSKGRCNVDHFSSHHELSDITNIIIIHTGHVNLLYSIIKVIVGSYQWPNQPGGAMPPKPKRCITQRLSASMLSSPRASNVCRLFWFHTWNFHAAILWSRWYCFTTFLLLPFPGVALMVPTWMFSQPDTFSWLRPPPVEGACALVAPAQISRGGESEIWHLFHVALSYCL